MPQGTMTLFKDFIRQVGGEAGGGASHDFNSGGEDYVVFLITNAVVADEDDLTPEAADYTEVSGGGYASITIQNQDWEYLDGEAYYVGDDPVWAQDGAGPTDCYQAILCIDDGSLPCIAYIDLTVDGGTTPLSLQDGPIGLVWGGLVLPGKIFKAQRGVAA